MIEVKQEKKALQIQKFSNKKETVSPTLMPIYFLEANNTSPRHFLGNKSNSSKGVILEPSTQNELKLIIQNYTPTCYKRENKITLYLKQNLPKRHPHLPPTTKRSHQSI